MFYTVYTNFAKNVPKGIGKFIISERFSLKGDKLYIFKIRIVKRYVMPIKESYFDELTK